ncbi:hypothetical protein CP533_4975 [Ophiocordyceps camponoti-saundersi (nom. inval.)]|nr:hypothetical protein CP533_4975 [Ophiocordyceps camponoti-saundersi (nom. inval.)]
MLALLPLLFLVGYCSAAVLPATNDLQPRGVWPVRSTRYPSGTRINGAWSSRESLIGSPGSSTYRLGETSPVLGRTQQGTSSSHTLPRAPRVDPGIVEDSPRSSIEANLEGLPLSDAISREGPGGSAATSSRTPRSLHDPISTWGSHNPMDRPEM